MNETATATPASQQIVLETEDRDRLVWIVESGLQVKSQSSFFLWTQGPLQLLLPHEVLLCCVKTGPSSAFHIRRFSSSRSFREEQFETFCDAQSGLLQRLLARWMRNSEPAFCTAGQDEKTDRQLIALGLGNVVAHGVWGGDGHVCGFFCFARSPLTAGARAARIVEVVVPTLYVTLLRVMAADVSSTEGALRLNNLVTQREVEILGWIKEGKTTADIARILNLSPFTVKNHVQNILKKLGARSRSHAIAQAMNLGLLNGGRI
jgi:transcriptional regulator EpsA